MKWVRLFLLLMVIMASHVLPKAGMTVEVAARLADSELSSIVLRAPALAAFRRAGPVRVLRSTPVLAEKGQTANPNLVDVLVVSYGTSQGAHAFVDAETRQVVRVRIIRGRPQSSEVERQEAERRIRATPAVAPLFRAGAYVVGGFAVDAPPGEPKAGRYLEFHIGSSDRKTILRKAVVNMATGKVTITQGGR
jgi:hypothetical protein